MELKRAVDISEDWRACHLYIFSVPMDAWVDKLQAISIKPGYSAREMEKEIAADLSMPAEYVILTCPLDE